MQWLSDSMNRHNNLPSCNVAFGGLEGFSCQDDTTESQLYYQGISVRALNSPHSIYFRQSSADHNNTHSISPLNEFHVASLTQAVPNSFDELDLAVIPKSILDEYVPWNSDNEFVDDVPFPALVNGLNLDHRLTNLPANIANPQDSRPVEVINPLNMQQATSDNPANSAEIVDDKPSQLERKRERQRERQRVLRNNPAYAKRERERRRERRRVLRKNPAYAERERERQRERQRVLRNNPAYAERERERHRVLRKNPAYAERERERERERQRELRNNTAFQNAKGSTKGSCAIIPNTQGVTGSAAKIPHAQSVTGSVEEIPLTQSAEGSASKTIPFSQRVK